MAPLELLKVRLGLVERKGEEAPVWHKSTVVKLPCLQSHNLGPAYGPMHGPSQLAAHLAVEGLPQGGAKPMCQGVPGFTIFTSGGLHRDGPVVEGA